MKNYRWVFWFVVTVTLVSFGGAIYPIVTGTDWNSMLGMSIPEILERSVVLPLAVMVAGMIFILLILRSLYRTFFPAPIPNGVDAPAKVLKVWDTGTSVNDDPQVGLLLEVTPPAGGAFQVESRTFVPRMDAYFAQPGIAATIRYDPGHPQRNQILELKLAKPGEGGSPTSRMEELERLREKRLISDAEYQDKRKEILDNL